MSTLASDGAMRSVVCRLAAIGGASPTVGGLALRFGRRYGPCCRWVRPSVLTLRRCAASNVCRGGATDSSRRRDGGSGVRLGNQAFCPRATWYGPCSCRRSRMYSSMVAIRPQTAARVLVADDQPDVLEALRWLLTGEGYEPEFVSSTDAVLERLRERPFDLLLMDLNYSRDTTSGREGLELIPLVRAQDPSMPIVLMTGWGSVDTAVEAMRRGAKSFVQKPWEDVTLLEILQREIDDARAI